MQKIYFLLLDLKINKDYDEICMRKGILEQEKRSAVLCYVCPECGYIELYAENPQALKPD
jgi:rubrerythrin